MEQFKVNETVKDEDWRATETLLRVIRGHISNDQQKPLPKLEIVEGITKYEDKTLFQTQIRSQDTLITEESCGPITTQIRFRQISTPAPPSLLSSHHLSNYLFVSTLEISCPVDVKWIFAFISCLPRVLMVRFGGSSFDGLIYLDKSQVKIPIKESFTLEELHLKTNPTKPINFTPSNANQRINNSLIEKVDTILQYAAKYFPRLIRAEFYLPRGTQLDSFLNQMPMLKENGTEKKENFINGTVYFTTNLPNVVKTPPLNKEIMVVPDQGKIFNNSSVIPGINDEVMKTCEMGKLYSTTFNNAVVIKAEERKCLKRSYTLHSESGQSNDDDGETFIISDSEPEDVKDDKKKFSGDIKVFKPADMNTMSNNGIALKNIDDLVDAAAKEKEAINTKIVIKNALKTFSYSSSSSDDEVDDSVETESADINPPAGHRKTNYSTDDKDFYSQFTRRKN